MIRGGRCTPCGAEAHEPCSSPEACPFTYNERVLAADDPMTRLFQYAMKPAAVAYVKRLVELQDVEITVGDRWCPNSGGPYEILGLVEIASDGPNHGVSTTQGVRVRDASRPEDSEIVYPLNVFLACFARVA